MLLAVDIGNSNIVFGVDSDDRWIETWRVATHPIKTPETYHSYLKNQFKMYSLALENLEAAVISSVVPALTPVFKKILEEEVECDVILIDHTVDSGIQLDAKSPEEIGSDLIADAVAAYAKAEGPCIVVDFGTATTIMGIDNSGKLTGVAICAGLQITADTMIEKAALLNSVPLDWPENILGRDTVEALQSGLLAGHVSMVERMIERSKVELGPAVVFATGGLAGKLSPHTDCFDLIEPYLTLNGMRIIAERNRDRKR